MDIKKLFAEDLNYNLVFEPISIEEGYKQHCVGEPQIAFEKKGINIIFTKLNKLNSETEKEIVKALKKRLFDSIFLFSDKDETTFNIYFSKLTDKKKEQLKKITYDELNGKTRLFKEKIRFFEVTEDITGKLSLQEKIEKAFDTEKVTKKFYQEFKEYHKLFLQFIKGIPIEKDKEWYASVLLNRLMFIYFIQKKGFIDNNPDYLKDKFYQIKEQNKNFYNDFLIQLFFIGFAEKEKTDDFKKKFGNVPYLNGGLFLPHQIELKYQNITIENSIFENLINYFDRYVWYLDDRPLKDENEINPDILGYIFEKYINQKELGAYYTKEDITGYICRNTIIPCIFDKIGEKNYGEFLKRIDIEEYIYDGIENREKRVAEIKEKFRNNEITNINDFITYNLDIEKFTLDYIDNLKNEEILKHLYFDILKNLTILDPTVGSGAFLFAGLNILYKIYEHTINKFPEFKTNSKYWRGYFESELLKIKQHPNVKYFILKSIIVNNIYGVDIVEEATEICKLRLFLKLIAQIDNVNEIEPLPDIDFNIKAGNTLVGIVKAEDTKYGSFGFSNIFDKIIELDKKISEFRKQQLDIGDNILKNFAFYQERKKQIEELEKEINDEINRDLYQGYGANLPYDDFLKRYKPFNWYVEFNEIIKSGGFDVIVGNPPYVEYSKIRNEYKIKGYKTEKCGNLYAFVVERSLGLLKDGGRFGMILPLSSISTDRMIPLQENLKLKNSKLWVSNFDVYPSKLFEGGKQRLSILISRINLLGVKKPTIWSTKYLRWFNFQRPKLFPSIKYFNISDLIIDGIFPKIDCVLGENIIKKIFSNNKRIQDYISDNNYSSEYSKIYLHIAPYYYMKALTFPPKFFNERDKEKLSVKYKILLVRNDCLKILTSIINSNLMYWYWETFSDCREVNLREILNFPIDIDSMVPKIRSTLENLCDKLMDNFKENSLVKECEYKTTGKVIYQEFYPRKSKHIIDKIDNELSKHYGFTNEEKNFIINYDINFRQNKNDNNIMEE